MFSDLALEENQSNCKKKLRPETANLTHRFPDKDSFSEAYFQKVPPPQWHFKTTLASILDCTSLTFPQCPHSSYVWFCSPREYYTISVILINILKATKLSSFP